MASPTPAVPVDKFLKGKERRELEKMLARMTELKLQKEQIELELKGDDQNPGLTDQVATLLVSHGHQKVEYDGFTHAIVNGTNVSYPWGKVQAALLRKGVDPDVIEDVKHEAKSETSYTTVMTLPVKSTKHTGGLTGK